MTDEELEDEMQERGLDAPRITPGHIDDVIVDEQYVQVPQTTLTLCILTLLNGTIVTGESACASPANFDAEIGCRLAKDDAKRKIWALEDYLLRQRIAYGQIEWIADSMIAKIAHEVNRVWCAYNGDHSQPLWDDAPEWQKESAMNGVRFHRINPGAPNSASHDSWMQEKIADGWVYGPVKDPEAKTHPCIMPFEQLPREQQFKDHLFGTIVRTCLSVDPGSSLRQPVAAVEEIG